ncbi:MAG: glutamine--fructose-6-phosphate transaminase (isomerizing) [Bifidobacteriaceae bacterium]|jgi:glucosamine--fructose-6-phosphate aminotransferase (isomerizing)|nr:glutamine--fructose-6-phosphate transaminase (isomerizing) [Bifidobacteriaceae bacterium]
MCGIIGYVGHTESTRPLSVVMEALSRLQYRGYDSAGVVVVNQSGLHHVKKAGKLAALEAELAARPLPAASSAVGHTRWATHGGPTDANAHPHLSPDGAVAVVHNGIIENHDLLRQELLNAGAVFSSQTDTEVAAHLLARAYHQTGDLPDAMCLVAQRLEGAFTLLAVATGQPHLVVGARRTSPLVVGLGEGENFLGSDVAAFVAQTNRALELGQDQVVTITPDSVSVTDFAGQPVEAKHFTVDWDASAAVKGGFATFMEKEIHDQPDAVRDTLLGRTGPQGHLKLDELRVSESLLRSIDKIIVVACGTAAYAGHVAKYAIEHWCRIPTEVELAHEFRYRDAIVTEKTLIVAISQSGETMDTIQAVRHAREQGAKVIAVVNTMGSTIARESDAALYTHAGPEVAVASTKAFLAQITATYLLGLYLAQLRGTMFADEVRAVLSELDQTPAKIQTVIESEDGIKALASAMKETKSVLFLGRHVGFPVAMEGALKLKELAYIHAEGFAAGELKHGPIALIDQGQPVFVVVPSPRGRDALHDKILSNIEEVRARGAVTLVVAEEGDIAVTEFAERVLWVPQTPTLLAPLVAVVPLQIFACALASAKGLDVDQPRNLAKSVTVE